MGNTFTTVVMPAFNAAQFIEKAIASVLAQTHPHFELVVVDDCSQDETAALVERLTAHDTRVRLIRAPRQLGAAAARNLAVKEGSGRFIAFLDSDDTWMPPKLEKQIAAMKRARAAVSCTAYRKMNEAGAVGGAVIHPPEALTYRQLLRSNSIACSTAMYDSQLLGKRYMPDIRSKQDYALWLEMFRSFESGSTLPEGAKPYVAVQEPLAHYRVRRNSLSGRKWRVAKYQWQIYRDFEALNVLQASYYFVQYMFWGFVKRMTR